MSAVLEHIHNLLNEAKAELVKLFGHGEAEVDAAAKAAAEKIDAVRSVVETDVPVLEHEAVTDAEHVVADAETEGIKPAEVEVVADAAHLAGETVEDVKEAVEAPATEPAPAEAAPAAEAPAETVPAAEAPAPEPASDTPAASA